jgi:type I restriction enzyme R subunit
VGLTATPAAHTKAYFRDVVFRYEFERAVREGYLVDYDAVRIHSDVRIHGLFLKEGEQVGMIDTHTGLEKLDELEDEREFAAADIEAHVTSPDSNRKIVEELRQYCDEHEARWKRFPKTLIFAVNDLPHTSHADALVEICRDVFGRGDAFVQKITGRVDRPLQRIREFRNRPNPGIVVSVDMLCTGVDIPDLEFIVMLRPVKSRILFEQMLGRGTRKGERCPDKSHFTVFDCFDGTLLEYFRKSTAITAEPPDKPTRSIVEIIDDIWANRDRDYNIRCLVKRLQRIDKEMSAEARELLAAFIPGGDMQKFARELPAKVSADFAGVMKLLRDKAFQDLLQTYPRKQRVFYVTYETEDRVKSEWLVRDRAGKEYKPEDYLTAFARFVQENATRIDAIRILLDRPQQWGTDALEQLRQTLTSAPERFTVENLQRVHAARYQKALVDIISMVKHAAREQEPLLTAAERVDRALARIKAGRTFTQLQQQWLDRIRKHLITNLTIDRDDFDGSSLFSVAENGR